MAQFPASSASTWLGRVRGERRAGRDPFDIAFVQPEAAITQGLPEGMWAPLRPLLIRPEVLDDAAWRRRLAERFLDMRGQFCFAWEYQVQPAYAVDSRVVKDGEIASVRDLLLPEWTGNVITSDPRSAAASTPRQTSPGTTATTRCGSCSSGSARGFPRAAML